MIRKYHNHKLQTNPSHKTITRHQKDKLSKATNSLFSIKMIVNLEWTQVTHNKNRTNTDSHNGSNNQQRNNNNRTTAFERTSA